MITNILSFLITLTLVLFFLSIKKKDFQYFYFSLFPICILILLFALAIKESDFLKRPILDIVAPEISKYSYTHSRAHAFFLEDNDILYNAYLEKGVFVSKNGEIYFVDIKDDSELKRDWRELDKALSVGSPNVKIMNLSNKWSEKELKIKEDIVLRKLNFPFNKSDDTKIGFNTELKEKAFKKYLSRIIQDKYTFFHSSEEFLLTYREIESENFIEKNAIQREQLKEKFYQEFGLYPRECETLFNDNIGGGLKILNSRVGIKEDIDKISFELEDKTILAYVDIKGVHYPNLTKKEILKLIEYARQPSTTKANSKSSDIKDIKAFLNQIH